MQMIRAKCKACEWVFDVVAIPMVLQLAADTMSSRSACPMCGCCESFFADSRPLTGDEIDHKNRVLAMPERQHEEREAAGEVATNAGIPASPERSEPA